MRKLYLQKEVIEAANLLKLRLTRSKLNYWKHQGVWPEPFSQFEKTWLWYKQSDVVRGLLNISKRLNLARKRFKRVVTQDEIKLALDTVVAKNKNLSDQLDKLRRE